MSAGATLLKLQQIDLELARNKSELANMPELKELASKRKTYVKLKAEMTKLYAQRKDLDIELDDLNTTEIQTNNAIEAAKKRHVDGSDYREVQDLENELATLAKRLDKIEHTRKDVVIAHKEACSRTAAAPCSQNRSWKVWSALLSGARRLCCCITAAALRRS